MQQNFLELSEFFSQLNLPKVKFVMSIGLCFHLFLMQYNVYMFYSSVIPTIFILFFLLLIVHGIFPLCLLLYGLYIDFPFRNIQYIERDGTEHYHTLKVFPETLTKKVTLLKYFRNYMNEHLLKVNIILCGFPK